MSQASDSGKSVKEQGGYPNEARLLAGVVVLEGAKYDWVKIMVVPVSKLTSRGSCR